MRSMLLTSFVAVILLFFGPSLAAATIRASFLTDRAALRDTLDVLRGAGCTREATETFERAVERYASTTFDFDFTKFPKLRDGFFTFESASALVAALPHPLSETQHPYEFNCFDTVFSLAGESLHTSVRADELAGPYLVPYTPTNGSFTILPRATARDAFTLVYPAWYRNVTENALPKAMRDARVPLTAALFRCHMLPQSTTDERLTDVVIGALQAGWKRQQMRFPTRFEVILCHEVNLPQRWFVTVHTGLVFPRKRGYTYIEKGGGSGPFLRLDFDDRKALLTWLGGMFRGAERLGYTHHFATFNDTQIEMLEFLKK
jgi:hypothetical protein